MNVDEKDGAVDCNEMDGAVIGGDDTVYEANDEADGTEVGIVIGQEVEGVVKDGEVDDE